MADFENPTQGVIPDTRENQQVIRTWARMGFQIEFRHPWGDWDESGITQQTAHIWNGFAIKCPYRIKP